MILADTSIWIEFFRQTNKSIDEKMTDCMENRNVVAISAVFGELLQGVRDVQEEKVILEYWKNLPKVNEQNLFMDAGRLSYQHKLFSKGVGLIDCYILAAARLNGLEVWTLDKKLTQAYQALK